MVPQLLEDSYAGFVRNCSTHFLFPQEQYLYVHWSIYRIPSLDPIYRMSSSSPSVTAIRRMNMKMHLMYERFAHPFLLSLNLCVVELTDLIPQLKTTEKL